MARDADDAAALELSLQRDEPRRRERLALQTLEQFAEDVEIARGAVSAPCDTRSTRFCCGHAKPACRPRTIAIGTELFVVSQTTSVTMNTAVMAPCDVSNPMRREECAALQPHAASQSLRSAARVGSDHRDAIPGNRARA